MTNRHASTEHFAEDLSIEQLYLQLAMSRAATIQSIIEDSTELPDPPAIVLTLAAAELANVTAAAGVVPIATPRSVAVSRRLIAEATRHDPRAGALAECALSELEGGGPAARDELVHEAVDSLAWACALLRLCAEQLETSEDGNADQLELAWLCLMEGAELLIALDRVAIRERELTQKPSLGDGGGGRQGGGRTSTR
jgi:hypothetical protein